MKHIELNQTEGDLFKKIGTFEIDFNADYHLNKEKLKNCSLLTKSLLERNAIPKVRLEYFLNPEYNLGNKKKSKKQIFEKNNRYGDDILEDGNFLKYLKFFIMGSDLPIAIKEEMIKIKHETSYDSDFVNEATPIIKRFYKEHIGRMEKDSFAEEIFKHSIDLGVDLSESERLRNAVMKLK